MTLVRALARSNNIVSIKLLMQVGIEPVCAWAERFGIHRNLLPYPSFALGIAESTVEENAAAFNVFANNGRYVQPILIEWVKDAHGKKIWQAQRKTRRVLSVTHCCQMVNALSCRMEMYHRQNPEKWVNAQTIGKSGSTNGAASVWFVGSTPSLTTAVYLGFDDNRPLGRDVFASKTAFPIWREFNRFIEHPIKDFYRDPSLKEVAINWLTGKYVGNDELDSSNVVTILE
jgi:penicillin-binding protein 1A